MMQSSWCCCMWYSSVAYLRFVVLAFLERTLCSILFPHKVPCGIHLLSNTPSCSLAWCSTLLYLYRNLDRFCFA